ncbi:MAG: pyrroline-5-carboxylate reductase [Phycisphaerae bacterium]|nr:pyrroline-5-carboxylate reductase [Phycisphaerae bacterium]
MLPRTQYEIAVIGSGNAAEGIVHGLLRRSVLLEDRIIATDLREERRKVFQTRFKVDTTDDNRHAVAQSFILLLAVKPQDFHTVVGGFADLIREDHLVISIMAGVSTRSLEAALPTDQPRVVRAMPNLAAHVGVGMTGIFPGRHAGESDLLRAQRIFEAGGRAIVLEREELMDAITAVSGTGPAYFYYFVEAIIAAGEKAGLSHAQATLLATQTCLGAARMMIESDESPLRLREKVASPGGTTQAAIASMDGADVPKLIEEGVLAAWQRSRELGR